MALPLRRLLRSALPTLLASLAPAFASGAPLSTYFRQAPFPIPAVTAPVFPARTFSIVDYGAVGDGRTLNTAAFARAIDACAQAGGGHVIIPPGLWLTGPIALKSRVDLHAEREALIQFTADHSAYPLVRRFGRDGFTAESPLHAEGQSDFALTGEGVYDGAGDTWRPVRRSKTTEEDWRALLARGGAVSGGGNDWWPSVEAMRGEDYLAELAKRNPHPAPADALPARDFLRPPLVSLTECRRVWIDGVTLRNSPSGLLAPDACTGLLITNATLFNEWSAQNGDGMDVNNCRDVAIYRCTLSTGDDAICMKAAGRSPWSGEPGLERVVVAECTVYHGHGGFVVGGTTEAGMRYLWATQCLFLGTNIGIRVKSGQGHGGLVRDVTVDHIFMRDIVNEAISFNTFYDNTPVTAAKVKPVLSRSAAKTPEFRDFHLHDLFCLGAGTAIAITGLPQRPVHGITIEHAVLTARRGFEATDAADITLRGVKIFAAHGPSVQERRTVNIRFEN